MITKADFSPTLLNNTTQNLLKIVEDFTNAFHKLYGHVVNEETIKHRIQALDYICFEDSPTNIENNLIELAKDCNASWDPTKRQITLNPRLNTKPDQLKLALFHELVHAVSHHQTNQKENIEQAAMQNTPEDTFDEIMTEYYANQIFQQTEGHAYQNTKLPNANVYTIKKDNQEYHVRYDGMAYEEYGQIGGFYDFFFGDSLLRARHFTQDEQNFINQFNQFFRNTSLAPNKNFNNTAYENFIYEKDPLKRFDTVIEMTSTLLTQRKLANVLKNFNLKNNRDLRRKITTFLPFDKDNTYENKLKVTIEQSTQQNTQQTIHSTMRPKATTTTKATA